MAVIQAVHADAEKQYRAYAKARGGAYMGITENTTPPLYGWRCNQGHSWFTLRPITEVATWCAHCYRDSEHTDAENVRPTGKQKLQAFIEGYNAQEVHEEEPPTDNIEEVTTGKQLDSKGSIFPIGSSPSKTKALTKLEKRIEEIVTVQLDNANPLTADIHTIEKALNWKCTTTSYASRDEILRWYCAEYHEIIKSINQVLASPKCTKCTKKSRR